MRLHVPGLAERRLAVRTQAVPARGIPRLRTPGPSPATRGLGITGGPQQRLLDGRRSVPALPVFTLCGTAVPGTALPGPALPELRLPGATPHPEPRLPGLALLEATLPRATLPRATLPEPALRMAGFAGPGILRDGPPVPRRAVTSAARAAPRLLSDACRVRQATILARQAAVPVGQAAVPVGQAAVPVGQAAVPVRRAAVPVRRAAVPGARPWPVLLPRRPCTAHRSGSLPWLGWWDGRGGDYIIRQPRRVRYLVRRMRTGIPGAGGIPAVTTSAADALPGRLPRGRREGRAAASRRGRRPRPRPFPRLLRRPRGCRPSRAR